jgi:N6-adenosine-specific RNA methylase IME4
VNFHPAADLFPMMSDEEFAGLCADINTNGLLEHIRVDSKSQTIIDGRNRYKACLKLGVEPKYEWWDGDDPYSYVASMNLHRRHLETGQKAAIGALIAEEKYKAEAAKRQVALAGTRKPDLVAILPQGQEDIGRSRELAAKEVGVSARYVGEAERIKRESPQTFEKLLTGAVTLPQAKRELDLGQREARLTTPGAFPEGKFRVIYADPPWQYSHEMTPSYGAVKYHYSQMDTTAIATLPISDLASDDAVLFLWVTSPKLEECFRVINAWGFKYKASFVWDKVKHNWGHYNSVRHEMLLICTRGSCTPDVPDLVDSVVSIERSDKHSEKPAYFRELIDKLYPHGPRLELFAREAAENWEVWGNEC